jgi:hypothetical protein
MKPREESPMKKQFVAPEITAETTLTLFQASVD